MLLIDGVKYQLWTPEKEEDLEAIVKEHFQEIFGQDAVFFDKSKLQTHFKKDTIPDGFIIHLGDQRAWSILEVELSKHPLHEHITDQLNKFIDAIDKDMTIGLQNRDKIIQEFDTTVGNDALLKEKFEAKLGGMQIHKFLSNVIKSQEPTLVVVIEEKTLELTQATKKLPLYTKIVELKTYQREGAPLVHAHLFEPLVKEEKPAPAPTLQPVVPVPTLTPVAVPRPGEKKEVILSGGALTWKKSSLIYFGTENRPFFPGYKVPFQMETDIGNITTRVTSSVGGKKGGTQKVGDPKAGMYIQGHMKPWFDAHPELKPGDKLVIEAIEPHKRYKLSIVQS